MALNQWTHLACVEESGSDPTGYIYINGMLVASGPVNQPVNAQRTNCFIGRSNWPSDAYAHAIFDEVRIWSVARSQTEIQANMHHRLVGSELNLTGYWRFDQSHWTD